VTFTVESKPQITSKQINNDSYMAHNSSLNISMPRFE